MQYINKLTMNIANINKTENYCPQKYKLLQINIFQYFFSEINIQP